MYILRKNSRLKCTIIFTVYYLSNMTPIFLYYVQNILRKCIFPTTFYVTLRYCMNFSWHESAVYPAVHSSSVFRHFSAGYSATFVWSGRGQCTFSLVVTTSVYLPPSAL